MPGHGATLRLNAVSPRPQPSSLRATPGTRLRTFSGQPGGVCPDGDAESVTSVDLALDGGQMVGGFFLWTALFNLPIYRAMAGWNETQSGEVWPLLRRFHRANVVRLAAALALTVLFFLAV
jgi:hypothetical protein